MNEQKIFRCSNCGHGNKVYPPDDLHSIASIVICETCEYTQKKWVKAFFECENCGQRNILYWHSIEGHTEDEINTANSRRVIRRRWTVLGERTRSLDGI